MRGWKMDGWKDRWEGGHTIHGGQQSQEKRQYHTRQGEGERKRGDLAS